MGVGDGRRVRVALVLRPPSILPSLNWYEWYGALLTHFIIYQPR